MDTKTKEVINRIHELTKHREISMCHINLTSPVRKIKKHIISNPFGQQWKYLVAELIYNTETGGWYMPICRNEDGKNLVGPGGNDVDLITMHFQDPINPTEAENELFKIQFGLDYPFYGL